MELMGNLKEKVSQSKDKEEAREHIEKAGMKLTDDELDKVAGGIGGLSKLGVPGPIAIKE